MSEKPRHKPTRSSMNKGPVASAWHVGSGNATHRARLLTNDNTPLPLIEWTDDEPRFGHAGQFCGFKWGVRRVTPSHVVCHGAVR